HPGPRRHNSPAHPRPSARPRPQPLNGPRHPPCATPYATMGGSASLVIRKGGAMSAPTRIIFMGTPDCAVPSLSALHRQAAANHWEIVAVVTQPDRPSGRGKKLTVSPVKAQAQAYDLPVQQPERLRRRPEAVNALAALAPDLIVVAAYGLILPPEVLALPTHGCINVHASLLPAYRGASPIAAAILDGLEETGVSIMLMDEGMDTGPVLAQAKQPIHPDD